MPSLDFHPFDRVLGDSAVLGRLERLGRNPRLFPNLVRVGFPPDQLSEARNWYIADARTTVEQHASRQLASGFFEDEALLVLFCRFYDCTDWKLENSAWFFSKEDYARFFSELVGPVEWAAAQLEAGQGEERWGGFFLKLPFDLGMEQAQRSLWAEIQHREHFWKAQSDYTHLRAEALFQYLQRSLDIARFSTDNYRYLWEQAFRAQLDAALQRFRLALEQSVRRWQEVRRQRTTRRFSYRTFTGAQLMPLHLDVLQAIAYLGLEFATVNLKAVKAAFRERSKHLHPDHGGDEEEFKRLCQHRQVLQNWLRLRARE